MGGGGVNGDASEREKHNQQSRYSRNMWSLHAEHEIMITTYSTDTVLYLVADNK